VAAPPSQQADSAQGNSQQTSQQAHPDCDATAPEATQAKFGLPSLPGQLSLLPTAYNNDTCFQQASDRRAVAHSSSSLQVPDVCLSIAKVKLL